MRRRIQRELHCFLPAAPANVARGEPVEAWNAVVQLSRRMQRGDGALKIFKKQSLVLSLAPWAPQPPGMDHDDMSQWAFSAPAQTP